MSKHGNETDTLKTTLTVPVSQVIDMSFKKVRESFTETQANKTKRADADFKHRHESNLIPI